MKDRQVPLILVFVVAGSVLGAVLIGCQSSRVAPSSTSFQRVEREEEMSWVLTSSAFENDRNIPSLYTCDGKNISPPLSWTKPPDGTAELALVCNDPDAPMGNWIHWVLYALPADQGSLPPAVPNADVLLNLGGAKQGENTSGGIGYTGPCPPPGPTHHYHFRLYALDALTNLEPGATVDELRDATDGHILAEIELVGLYSR